jgi:cytoskeleton protein RodZ
MPEIGATLREARMRARIDVSEIEAQTKIRAKYLRALENEEWGLLPGPTFVKSFLRTYAQALGLDGKALVEEYRLHHERGNEAFEPIVSTPRSTRGRPQRTGPSRGYMLAVTLVGGLIVLLIILLVTSGGSKKGASSTPVRTPATVTGTTVHKSTAKRVRVSLVALSLHATGAVYVCLIGDNNRKLVPGTELQAGESTPTFHDSHFLLNLGNSSVTMYVDGRAHSVPPSSEPIGYSITKARGRQRLSAAQLPTCK